MAASLGNAMGAIGGISKSIEGKKMQKKAQRAIDAFEWQELQNPFESLSVSTMGADLRREENARMGSTSVQALSNAGTRALVGGIGKVNEQNNLVSRDIAANLDEQQKSIDYSRAGMDAKIQDMTETRQSNELAGYGQMLNVGLGMKYQGMTDIMNAGNAQSEHNMSLFSTFFGGGGGGGMTSGGGFGGGAAISDRRLKKNIQYIKKSPSGLNIYTFEYKDNKYGEGLYQGVMSDEVPEQAVISMSSGFDGVNYNLIDVDFKRIK